MFDFPPPVLKNTAPRLLYFYPKMRIPTQGDAIKNYPDSDIILEINAISIHKMYNTYICVYIMIINAIYLSFIFYSFDVHV